MVRPQKDMTNDTGREQLEIKTALPKYSAWGWQLNRIEELFDTVLKAYRDLKSVQGRDNFATGVEALYIAIAPRLTKSDKKYVKSYIIRIRGTIDNMNNESYQNNQIQQAEQNNLRKLAWALLEIMQMLKDRRGLGMELQEEISWEDELAESADIMPEAKEKEQPIEDEDSGDTNE